MLCRSPALFICLAAVSGLLLLAVPASAQLATQPSPPPLMSPVSDAGSLVRADLRLERTVVQSGQPVWADLSLTNLTADPLLLQVPDVPVDPNPIEQMGLPISHVFSGIGFSAISIKDTRGEVLDSQVALRPRTALPALQLAPYGQVGMRLELTRFYEALLRRPGKYTLVWRPYGGTMQSAPVTITLLAEQQAVLLTDMGKLTIRFYYEEAPRHVDNFIELVNQRFYDNLTFHRVIAGGIIQGGDPRGDGRGVRPDGKRIPAEFSNIPFEAGTVGMARSPKDPDSASCQFFICMGRQASFDGRQTAFGYLVGDESFETLRKIASVPTDSKDRPKKPVYIRAISLENVPARDRELANLAAAVTTTRPSAWQDSRVFNLSRKEEAAPEPAARGNPVPATRPGGASGE